MRVSGGRHARWSRHVNAVNPPSELRHWLTDRSSLTRKLIAHSRQFRVQALRQGRALCIPDECAAVGLPRRLQVQERDVLLHCDGHAVVFGHTIVPSNATAADWPFFSSLGDRSLGSALFSDPRVRRGKLQFARLRSDHPLVRRAAEASSHGSPVLYARRCLYRRRNGLLLVTELFLPKIAGLRRQQAAAEPKLSAVPDKQSNR